MPDNNAQKKPVSPPAVWWSDETVRMLDNRDRYTRSATFEYFGKAISAEFNGAASAKFIKFDDLLEGYVTPVLDNRYMVVWYHDKKKNSADVVGFAPYGANLDAASLPDRHGFVQRAIKRESKGRVNLP